MDPHYAIDGVKSMWRMSHLFNHLALMRKICIYFFPSIEPGNIFRTADVKMHWRKGECLLRNPQEKRGRAKIKTLAPIDLSRYCGVIRSYWQRRRERESVSNTWERTLGISGSVAGRYACIFYGRVQPITTVIQNVPQLSGLDMCSHALPLSPVRCIALFFMVVRYTLEPFQSNWVLILGAFLQATDKKIKMESVCRRAKSEMQSFLHGISLSP